MKNNIKKILCVPFALLMSFSMLVGCGKTQENNAYKRTVSLPDYSSSNYEFTLMSSEPPAGYITFNSVNYPIGDGTSYHSIEGYKQWKDLGLNTLQIGSIYGNGFGIDETWENSKLKADCEVAYASGIKKMYINDLGFRQYTQIWHKPLVHAQYGIYKSEADLDAYITSRLEQYIDEDYVIGVEISDEPKYTYIDNLSELSRSIRRCATNLGHPDFEVFVNAYQLRSDATQLGVFGAPGTYQNVRELYHSYLEKIFHNGNLTTISADDYPYSPNGLSKGFYATLQAVREVANIYNLKMAYYADSFLLLSNGKEEMYRAIGQAELYHNLNSLLAFGVTQIQYFAYAPYPFGYDSANAWYEYCNFVDRYNNPNDLYYYAQKMFKEYQGEFSNVFMNYKQKGVKFYMGNVQELGGVNTYLGNIIDSGTNTVMNFVNDYVPMAVKGVELDSEICLISEFEDTNNGLTMIEVMNPQDPFYTEYGRTDAKITVDLGSEYEWVAEYDRGKLTYVKLNGGKYTKTLSAGYATYIIPIK